MHYSESMGSCARTPVVGRLWTVDVLNLKGKVYTEVETHAKDRVAGSETVLCHDRMIFHSNFHAF